MLVPVQYLLVPYNAGWAGWVLLQVVRRVNRFNSIAGVSVHGFVVNDLRLLQGPSFVVDMVQGLYDSLGVVVLVVCLLRRVYLVALHDEFNSSNSV